MVVLTATESIDSAFRRLIREMISNGIFKHIEDNRFRIPEGQIKREKKRAYYKTKRKRAAARRKNRNRIY